MCDLGVKISRRTQTGRAGRALSFHISRSQLWAMLARYASEKLYQSTGRAADAHAFLALALEGFSPTPEFPEIEEAQALLAALKP
jgi:hypothetical protein